jgi:hypothetical protein
MPTATPLGAVECPFKVGETVIRIAGIGLEDFEAEANECFRIDAVFFYQPIGWLIGTKGQTTYRIAAYYQRVSTLGSYMYERTPAGIRKVE